LEGAARDESPVKRARHFGFSVVGHARQRTALIDGSLVLFVLGTVPFVARYPLAVCFAVAAAVPRPLIRCARM